MRGRFNGRVVGQEYTGRNTRHNGRAGMYNAVQSAFAPSLDITLANGLWSLFTYTRATTATVKEGVDGLIKSCLSGELRVQGARRVENKSTRTESLDNAAWSRLNANITTGVSAPDGTNTAYTLTATGANGEIYQALTTIAGTLHRGSWWIRRRTGSGTVSMYQNNGATAIADPSATWQRMTPAAAGAATTTTVYSGIKLATSGDAVDLWHPQLQDVTGQALQVPDEYVPNDTGIYSSPYSGYFASGVKYFSYENGNTVASNVVTEASGAALIGTIGYLAEGARTNLLPYNNAFTTAPWANSGGLAATQNVVGPDGATSAWTMTGTGAQTALMGSLTLEADTYSATIFVKKTSGGTTYPVLDVASSTAVKRALATLDPNTGTATVWTAVDGGWTITTSSASAESFNSDYWRLSLKFLGTANTDWIFRLYPAGGTTSTQSSGAPGNGTGNSVFFGGGIEKGQFPSSYIATPAGSAVARNEDILSCPYAGILDINQGSAFAEVVVNGTTGAAQIIIGLRASQDALLYRLINGNGGIFDGSTATEDGALANALPRKIASSWGGGTKSIVVQGSSVTSGSFDGAVNPTAIYIGTTNNGADNLFGVIKRISIYKQKLSDAQLTAMTS